MRPKFALVYGPLPGRCRPGQAGRPGLGPRDGCDCHIAVPPTNGAPAAHTPFVASVSDCTVCHTDWVVPHPHAKIAVGCSS